VDLVALGQGRGVVIFGETENCLQSFRMAPTPSRP